MINALKFKIFLFLIFSHLAVQAQVSLRSILNDKLYLHVTLDSNLKMIESESLKKIYELNSYSNLWTEKGQPNAAAQALKNILLKADDWGLSSAQYMTPGLLNLFNSVTDRNAITLEMLLSEAYLRFAQDLSNGQLLDPDLIDEDIKVLRKKSDETATLLEAAKNPAQMESVLARILPQHEKYKKLNEVLKKLNAINTAKTWTDLKDPGGELKPGNSHRAIPEIKRRLNDLGYPVSNTSAVFDDEMLKAVNRYQELNSMTKSKVISKAFFKSISPSLQERIDQVKVNMEKFRWFPKQWESRHLYVNLSLQEMQIRENGSVVMQMKTVNGRSTRRTPTMRDEIRIVELNPTWTVPRSIAVKDKLPLLQENAGALEAQHIYIYDSRNTKVDPYSVNWADYNRNNFNFTLVQQPGKDNALGLVKFPLTNPWFIYLHDTNEPWLMNENDRQRSSGCIRLERAFDLAEYLLKDQPQWTMPQIKSQTQEQYRIRVRNSLPVYFMYQTVDVTDAGEIRTSHDQYGQDARLIELFQSRGSREKF